MIEEPLELSPQEAPPSRIEAESEEDQLTVGRISTSSSESCFEGRPGDEFEIERIVNVRIGKGAEPVYKIKWKNYGPDECTWEAESSLRNCPELIKDFYRNRDKATKKRELMVIKVDPENGNVKLEIKEMQLYPESKFLRKNKDLYIEKVEEEMPDEISDLSDYEDSEDFRKAEDKEKSEPDDGSLDLSGSSFESAGKKNPGLILEKKKEDIENPNKIKKKKKKQPKPQVDNHDGGTTRRGSFLDGDFPLKIISHKFMGKSLVSNLHLDLLVKWRTKEKDAQRPDPSWVPNFQLKLLEPELMCNYYKKLFIEMIQRKHKEQKTKDRKKILEEKKKQKSGAKNSSILFQKPRKTKRRTTNSPVNINEKGTENSNNERPSSSSQLINDLTLKSQNQTAEPKGKPVKPFKKKRGKLKKNATIEQMERPKVVDLTSFVSIDNKIGSSYFTGQNQLVSKHGQSDNSKEGITNIIAEEDEIFCE